MTRDLGIRGGHEACPFVHVGNRDGETAKIFTDDLKSRLAHRVPLTTDGDKADLEAVEEAFGLDIDHALLVKIYGLDPETEKRYSPSKCIGAEKISIMGKPDVKHVATSYMERQNVTMRMGVRRFTRLTNAFSMKVENLACAVALHFMYYNFGQIHQKLRVTPAMEAKISDYVWELKEIVGLVEP